MQREAEAPCSQCEFVETQSSEFIKDTITEVRSGNTSLRWGKSLSTTAWILVALHHRDKSQNQGNAVEEEYCWGVQLQRVYDGGTKKCRQDQEARGSHPGP